MYTVFFKLSGKSEENRIIRFRENRPRSKHRFAERNGKSNSIKGTVTICRGMDEAVLLWEGKELVIHSPLY